jgi:N-acetylmuramoyl-L-alanine amidase
VVQPVCNLNSFWRAGAFVATSLLALGQNCSGAEPTPKEGCPKGDLRVGVDIGHSVVKYGARSARGGHEFAFNKRFVNELSTYGDAESHLNFIVLNPRGQDLALRERPQLAMAEGADIFISIHHDAVNDKYLQPWMFEDRPEQCRSPTLHHAEPIKGEGRKLINADLGIYEAPFAVLVSSPLPSVLIEIGVIVNRTEEEHLNEAEFRNKIEQALFKALEVFCKSAPS